jgi:hypothetical protein
LKKRQAWFEDQLDFDPEKLVFIDETGASTKMARLHGRAARVCAPACHTVIGKPRLSSAHCVSAE